jgi:hypothetical protein
MPLVPPEQRSPYGRSAADRRGDAMSVLDIWLSFDDLKRAGIVNSWKTLGEWQRDPRINFPPGRLFAPNTRRWSKQHEIDPWLASRPVERNAFDDTERAAAEALP